MRGSGYSARFRTIRVPFALGRRLQDDFEFIHHFEE